MSDYLVAVSAVQRQNMWGEREERQMINVPEQTQTLVVTWYNSAEWSEPQESIKMAVMWAHMSFLLWFLGATLFKALKWQHQILGDLFYLCAVSAKVVPNSVSFFFFEATNFFCYCFVSSGQTHPYRQSVRRIVVNSGPDRFLLSLLELWLGTVEILKLKDKWAS